MRLFFILVFVWSYLLKAQGVNNSIYEHTKNTFSDTHVNKWLVINRYENYNDSIIYTEASLGNSIYQCWKGISLTVQNQNKLLVADIPEREVFEVNLKTNSKRKKPKPIKVKSKELLFFQYSDSVKFIETDSGYILKNEKEQKDFVVDKENYLLKRIEIKYNQNESEELRGTDWYLIEHIKALAETRKLIDYGQYISIVNGKPIPIGPITNFEFNYLN